MFFYSKSLLIALVFTLTACKLETLPNAPFAHRGPESLIDVSSEVVNFGVATKKDVQDLTKWIAKDAPTRAELRCDAMSSVCRQVISALEKKGVAFSTSPSSENIATLVYERIVARDCRQRHRSPHMSNFGAPSESFGCSVSANVVQHVSDKSVFINPDISDVPMSKGTVAAMGRLNAPRQAVQQVYTVRDTLAR